MKEAEARAEFAEKTVKKLQKEVDRLEGKFHMLYLKYLNVIEIFLVSNGNKKIILHFRWIGHQQGQIQVVGWRNGFDVRRIGRILDYFISLCFMPNNLLVGKSTFCISANCYWVWSRFDWEKGKTWLKSCLGHDTHAALTSFVINIVIIIELSTWPSN